MKTLIWLILVILLAGRLNAQQEYIYPQPTAACLYFNHCAAVFFNDTILVNELSPRGECKLPQFAKGTIFVAKYTASKSSVVAKDHVPFQLAIRNNRTNTMRMYSAETYTKVSYREVVEDCEPEDEIMIILLDKKVSLSHHTIKIIWGC